MELYHYGTPRHSGRYPYGSGEDPYQHPYKEKHSFLAQYNALKQDGKTDTEIAGIMGMSVNDFRKKRSIAAAEQQAALVTRAQRLRAKGISYAEIGRIMGGYGDTTVRNWCKRQEETRKTKLDNVANLLEDKVKKGDIIDVGKGSELSLGVTSTTFTTALKALKEKGYVVDTIDVPQPNDPSKNTTVKYLAPEGTTKRDAWNNRDLIKTLSETSPDQGVTINPLQHPTSIDAKRVKVVYNEEVTKDGTRGVDRDGMISIRRGVPDLTMGASPYSQVRIAVNGTHYIKGMAIYDDVNIPDGYDIVVWSNKHKGTPMLGEDKDHTVLKPLKHDPNDPDNIFGANIKANGQSYYKDKKGQFCEVSPENYVLDPNKKLTGERYSLSPINKLKEESDWDNYRDNLPAQFLSKQPTKLIRQQLDVTYANYADEFNEIMSNTNPVVRKKLLDNFAGECDKTARHLDAAALPRQASKVIIPVPSLKDNEIYAPGYNNGEELLLVRFPHAGPFESPKVIVNNRNPEAKALLKNSKDAVGINKNVADRLSGADFDGDTVLTLPFNEKVKFRYDEPLKQLEGWDNKEAYPGYPGMKRLEGKAKNKQMGIVTNLITDMTVQNADPTEIARAVKHSMVIIDAEKHNLNWKQSEIDNGIDALKRKYQKHSDDDGYGGASTLLSRLGNATVRIKEQQLVDKNGKRTYTADPETGEYHYADTNRGYKKYTKDRQGNQVYNPDGTPAYEMKYYTQEVSPLQIHKDAHELSTGTPQEELYANHINKMTALANQARKEALAIGTPARDPEASKNYTEEVKSLNSKLAIALANKPLERQAQLKASKRVELLSEDVKADKDKYKKAKNRILREARAEVGAGKHAILITPKEWEAIQARAISGSKFAEILEQADMDVVRKLSNPRQGVELSSAKQNRIKALNNSGMTIAEIAAVLDCSTSTVSKYL